MTQRRHGGRMTDVEKIVSILEAQDGHQMRTSDLRSRLQGRDPRWTEEKFGRKLAEAIATTAVEPVAGPHGLVRYSGAERSGGSALPSIYDNVARVLLKHGIPGCRCRGQELRYSARTHGVRGQVWTTPDFIVRCHPTTASGAPPPVLHTIEVETAAGFSIQSVYQAHAQGYGSDYAWVMFDRGKSAGGSFPHPDETRIRWAAATLGVGLVSFSNSNSRRTWKVEAKAKRRIASRAQRSELTRIFDRARPL